MKEFLHERSGATLQARGQGPGNQVPSLVSIASSRASAAAAARVIRDGPVGEGPRRALDEVLASQDDGDLFRRGLKNERAYALTSVREMSGSIFWLKGWMLNNLTLMFLDLFDEELKRADLPFPQAKAPAAPSLVDGYWHPLKPLATLLRPAIESFRQAVERNRAAIRALRVLNALQARVPADAASPPALDGLGLPREATLDPFTGSPLIVKKLPTGWLVYSVGTDLADDGGDLEKDRDVGFGPEAR